MTTISGARFDECYAARTVAELDHVTVSLISLEHLKANKRSAGRFKDLDDLEHLPVRRLEQVVRISGVGRDRGRTQTVPDAIIPQRLPIGHPR